MRTMKLLSYILALFLLGFAVSQAERGAPEGEWIQLFNGKDLEDWTVKIKGYEINDNFANTFRVEDGLLKVAYDGYGDKFEGKFGHLFYKEPFSHYRLRVEYRFTGDQVKAVYQVLHDLELGQGD